MIVLIGFMAAGKTTVGRALARELGLPFVDTDALIEQRGGAPVHEIFSSRGEAAFRDLERAVVMEVLDGPEAVVALGGGALGDPGTCAALEWANVVHLEIGFEEAVRRARRDGVEKRPLLDGDVRALYEERRPTYERIGGFRIAVEGRSPEVLAKEIAMMVGAAGRGGGTARVLVPLGERSYEIIIGEGIAARAADFLPVLSDAEKAFVVTHPGLRTLADPVAASLAGRGLSVTLLEVEPGEASKEMSVARGLLEALAEAPAHRADLLVSVGGGVVSDLTGFVASVFARGLRVAHVPTSLLGQVDAAIGGKTAVNLPQAKNLVGTIHQPLCVVCDVGYLESLPEAEFVSGMAEVVKYGLIADPSILTLVRERGRELPADPHALTDLVTRSGRIKAAIVSEDENEMGIRAHLNYGHTFAHALERAERFRGIRHGEAVALGMVAAANLAFELDMLDEAAVRTHIETLAAAGLPVRATMDIAELEPAWQRDKKYRGGVRFVLLRGIGRPEAGVSAERAQVVRALERMAP